MADQDGLHHGLIPIVVPEVRGSKLVIDWLKSSFVYVSAGVPIARFTFKSHDINRAIGRDRFGEVYAPADGYVRTWTVSRWQPTQTGREIGLFVEGGLPKSYRRGLLARMRSSGAPVRESPPEIRTAITSPQTSEHGIFVSYRRLDQAAFAGRLYDRLVKEFGKSAIFMDVDSVDLGLDFVDVLHEALSKCRVLIVVIGRSWLSATDELVAPRLENPDDFVRLEVEVALERGLRVIPVLVDGAPMPKVAQLPATMAPLARRNGREVSNARFGSDTIELINTLRRILEG